MPMLAALVGIVLAVPSVAAAHAFGTAATLELPFSYLALGAAVALIYSFGTFLMFSRPDTERPAPLTIRIGRVPMWLAVFMRLIVGIVIVWIIAVHGTGTAAIFWIGCILIVAYMSTVLDGVWFLINPIESFVRTIVRNARVFAYPSWLGSLPALLVYAALIAVELFSNGWSAMPASIALIVISYLTLSIVGSALFGVSTWFSQADFFNTYFRMYGAIAPVRIDGDRNIAITSPVASLTKETPQHISALFFVLFMIASTSFDGVLGTAGGRRFIDALPGFSSHALLWQCGLLLLSVLGVSGLYMLVIWLMRISTRTRIPQGSLSLRFAYTLIPIAIAYNVAHYFMIVAQSLSWDIRAEAVWTTQVAVVTLGHIYATYLAHRVAARVYPQTRNIIVGQIPMLALMIFFTIAALRILSLAS